ncbi:MAG: biotin transporter BioY [Elusimicrobia bacterium]|nr:biotin transporter BioY [Elusimicrobiota bacterium]
MVLAETLVPLLSHSWTLRRGAVETLLLLAGASLVAVSAQIAIPLPFTPVPITGQTFSVLLLGMALGPRRGFLALLIYLAAGISGAPVFAQGLAGPAVFLGPRGGYLLGFPLAAYVAGRLGERGWDRKPWTTALAMALGSAVIFIPGVCWLSFFVGWDKALLAGFYPFLAGDAVKIILATATLPFCWKFLSRFNLPG